jgi:hypothetical protein
MSRHGSQVPTGAKAMVVGRLDAVRVSRSETLNRPYAPTLASVNNSAC